MICAVYRSFLLSPGVMSFARVSVSARSAYAVMKNGPSGRYSLEPVFSRILLRTSCAINQPNPRPFFF